MIKFFELDDSNLASVADGPSTRRSKTWSFPSGKATMFYFLPPYNESGSLFKKVKSCYLHVMDKSDRFHTAWETFDDVRPGIGKSDPVVKTLWDLYKSHPNVVKRMLPQTKVYANILIGGYMKLDGMGNPISSSLVRETDESSVTVAFPSNLAAGLTKALMTESMKGFYNPTKAIPIVVIRTGEKRDTKYSFRVTGNDIPGRDFEPNREDLTSKRGPGSFDMEDIISSLRNLDNDWIPPTDEDIRKAKEKSIELRERILNSSVSNEDDSDTPVTAEDIVSRGKQNRKNEDLDDGIKYPPSPGTPDETPAQKKRLSPEEVISLALVKKLPIKSPPQKDSKTAPVCFKKYNDISGSPNSDWCKGCKWVLPCKVGSGVGE